MVIKRINLQQSKINKVLVSTKGSRLYTYGGGTKIQIYELVNHSYGQRKITPVLNMTDNECIGILEPQIPANKVWLYEYTSTSICN